ncbi:MAG: purine-nucleoside phosphorylase [Gemmatimonadota bacterium]|nr:purine-nucleoside phosphorylase [Gemmatimonadota bacterium]
MTASRFDPQEQSDRLRSAADWIRSRVDLVPDVGVILGTGLGGLAEKLSGSDGYASLPYEEIPHFPTSTVESHHGRLHFGELGGRTVVAMQGRFHRYEGYGLRDVVFPVRVLRLLGVETLIVSAACGGMNPLWSPGDLVLLDDHINFLGDNPLVGPNLEDFGPRFPDMSRPYDRALGRVAIAQALDMGIPLRQGVYVAVLGPNLETRAEYRMLRALGADVVGMSTVPEVIVARHAGMRVVGLAIITDQCLPDALQEADVATIIQTAMAAEPKLTELVTRVIAGSRDLAGGLDRTAS